jgi:hypothetical protein
MNYDSPQCAIFPDFALEGSFLNPGGVVSGVRCPVAIGFFAVRLFYTRPGPPALAGIFITERKSEDSHYYNPAYH